MTQTALPAAMRDWPAAPHHAIWRRTVCLAGLLVASLMTLSACTLVPKGDPIDTYLLPSSDAAKAAPAHSAQPISLRINKPYTGLRTAGHRIVVVPQDQRISVYKGAQWSDPAPVLVRNRLLDAFRADGRIAYLSSDDNVLQVHFELDSDLRAFQTEYRGETPEVVIVLDARLIDPGLKKVVASRRFEIIQPVQGKEVPEVVTAFGKASDALSKQVVDWVVQRAAVK